MFSRAMDRTVPRFIPPLPDAGDQIKYKELSDRRSVTAQTRPSGSGLSKNDTTSRPCAIIGPDGIAPQYRKLDAYPSHIWPQTRNGAVPYYRPAPAQYYGEQIYPPRNISPRHTFQENMSRFIVPSPAEIKVRNDAYLTANNPNSNFVLPNGGKRNISPSVKFCEGAVLVPHSIEVLRPQYHKSESPAGRLDVQGPPLTQLTAHGIPVTNMHEIPYTHTNNLYPYNTEYQRYPHDYQNHGIHVVKSNPAYQAYPEQQSPYYIANDYAGNPYGRVNGVRYEPYPPVKDKYVHARYDYSYQISNEYGMAHGAAPKLHESRKKLPPSPADVRYYPLHQKYLESHPHIADPEYRTKISNRKNPNGVPYVTDVPNYPADRFSNQAKIFEFNFYDKNSQIAGDPRPVAESTKIKIDYYNHCKNLPYADVHYSNDNPHNLNHIKGGMSVYNYPMRPPEVYHPYTFNGNYHKPVETHNIDSDMNHQKPYYNPLAKIPTEFSPNIISPTESNASFDSSNTVTHQQYQEDGGYVSQCSTISGQSVDYQPNGNIRSYDRIYNAMPVRPANPYATGFVSQNNVKEVKQMKNQNVNKCSIDLRQFVEMWDEEFEEQTQLKTLPETFAHKNVNLNLSQPETSYLPVSEELYVLDKMTISKDDLHKYEHIQKVTKLPDNIKDYEQVEITKINKFSKDTEMYGTARVNVTNRLDNYHDCNQNSTAIIKSKGPRVDIVKSHTSVNEPIDVEAKITQSIIHKEVGCNFEIKPCSPGKQVQMSSVSLSVEQKIDKVSRDCNLNGDIKKSHPKFIPNANDIRDKNTRNMDIMHNINFFGEVKNTTKTVRDNDSLLHKNKLQSVGSSLPQIVNDDVHIANTSVNNSFGTCKFENSQNQIESSKVLGQCKQSITKIDCNEMINEINVSVEKELNIKKYSGENHVKSEYTIKKSQNFNATLQSETSFSESFTLPICSDSNSTYPNPTVIKSNYGRKSFSPVNRVEIESNKISVLTSTETSMDLTVEKGVAYDARKEKNNIAQLHIPDIPEIVTDTNRLDKVTASAVILSNTDSSKVIHTTLERVIEAIESNIDNDLTVIPETLHSDNNDVSYSDLAMDYTSASLDQEAIIDLHVSLKDVASTPPGDIHSKIIKTNEVLNVEEKNTLTRSPDTYPLIEQIMEVEVNKVEKQKSSLKEKEATEIPIHASDKILVPSESWNISKKSPDTCQNSEPHIVFNDIHKHPATPKDNQLMFEIPLSKSCEETFLPILNEDRLPSSESSAMNLCQDSKTNDSGLEIVTNHVNHETLLSSFNKDPVLSSEVVTTEPSDATLPIAVCDFSLPLQSSDADSLITDVLCQMEVTNLNEQLDSTENVEHLQVNSNVENLQYCNENAIVNDSVEKVSDKPVLETKLTNLSDNCIHIPTVPLKDGNEFDVTTSESSQSDTDTSESTSSDETEYRSEENTSTNVPNQANNSSDGKDDALKNTVDENVKPSIANNIISSICSYTGEESSDAELAMNSGFFENPGSEEKVTDIPYSSSETWNINHSMSDLKPCLEDVHESKSPEMCGNITFRCAHTSSESYAGSVKESVVCDIDAIDSLAENNCDTLYSCNSQVMADVLICSNSYSKSEDSVDATSVTPTLHIEGGSDLYNSENTVYVGIQEQKSIKNEDDNTLLVNENGCSETLQCIEPDLSQADAEISSSRDTDDPILNESSHYSPPHTTSEGEISNGEVIAQEVEISKIEHDGLELGGCWIDDIACVETVVSEEVNFPNEIAETTVDSAQFWDPNSSDDDDNISHMLHYHIDSVGNILKDTNGNVILTNPLFEISKESKQKKTTVKNNDYIIKKWKSNDLQNYTQSVISSPPKIDLLFPKKSNLKNSFKDLDVSERRKRKSSSGEDQTNKQEIPHKSKRRKRSIDSELSEMKNKLVRKIDTNEKCDTIKYNVKDALQGTQSNHYSGGRILTKGAQKYIPPIVDDLKVHLPLPEKKLLSLSKLNSPSVKEKSQNSAENTKEDSSNIRRMVLQKKKPKPKFEDVLKSIEISTISWSKKRAIKFKQSIPKMVIKKNKHGSHYTSVNTEKTNSPDMTGSKWQPLVSIGRNACIEEMIKNKELQTIYCNVVCSSGKMYTSTSCLTADKRRSMRDQNNSNSPVS